MNHAGQCRIFLLFFCAYCTEHSRPQCAQVYWCDRQSKNCGRCVAVPVGVPAVQLSIANTSLLVEWSVLPPEKARGRITGYHVLLRQRSTGNQPSMEQPIVVTVANFTQHVIDGMALMI